MRKRGDLALPMPQHAPAAPGSIPLALGQGLMDTGGEDVSSVQLPKQNQLQLMELRLHSPPRALLWLGDPRGPRPQHVPSQLPIVHHCISSF